MKRKEDEPKKGAPAYMNTYGDMVTLLLCFFVLLFSMSTVDADKFEALTSSLTASIGIFSGGETIQMDTNVLQNGMSYFPVQDTTLSLQGVSARQQALTETQEELSEYIQSKDLDDKVTVEKTGEEIIMRFADVLLFDTGKAEIKAGAVPTLSAIGEQLKSYMEQGYILNIEGHTDNVPIQTSQFPSNWYLSSARAIAVASFYIDEMGFDRTKVTCVGCGEFQPVASNETAEGRAMNRRVDIKLSLPIG
ncbi:MAG: OmpA family protein [Candidatus Cellulosilyticum pullistercoris]|uniref:OmpA family protein n=1 Tax=Candidatus Cellulosilyticum pullistercoris TaxID=2838521 RepID=A0A9E2NMD3_9FIRM|nr:OmpA family protein [Candidatus Cellulosilyticum pullistercoris]